MKDSRTIAYELLQDWEEKKTFPNLALKTALRSTPDPRERGFITALVYGVIEKKITLDYYIGQCANNKAASPGGAVRSVLRLGIYQMFYMRVPASAACNTSVELIKRLGKSRSAGFVNAVLRRCDRERDTLLQLKKTDFSVRYSISAGLVDLLIDQYGKNGFCSIMDSLSHPSAAVYIYHNFKKGDESDFLSLMQAENILLSKTDLPHLFKSESGFSIEDSAAFRTGWFHIVGYHSALAALMLQKKNARILDLCAAPGGKTFILAALTEGLVQAYDIHPHKVELLQKAASRLGHSNVEIRQGDAARQNTALMDSADFVLCDVPCSGLGMMGKKPDIKYKAYNSSALCALQYQILENGASYLKKGGRLVYSTCTIDQRENELLVTAFLKEHPELMPDETAFDGFQKCFLPDRDQDGFYIAVLKKKG
ncbi:MAG: hypothetical protein DBX52_04565 [Clostridiales bacterium]|nr:MAG: hypothetical protein DBX52_04565 [Clostridiales bacterium]